MKKGLTVFIVLLLVLAGVWYFVGENQTTQNRRDAARQKVNITTSSYVVYALAREIGGDQVELSMLVPPGTEPHHFEPTPGAIISVSQSDLFLYVSPQAEPWVLSILNGLSGVRTLETAPIEEEEDPHVWMTPQGALSMARLIAQALAKLDPTHKAYYRANLKKFEKEMDKLHAEFAAGLANCKHREVIHIGHLAFGPLAQVYGLELETLSGTTHQGEHSVRRLTGLVKRIRKKQTSAVFTEETLSPDLARTVAMETLVRVLPLYTIEEVSKEDFDRGVTYSEYMHRNLKNLQEGLQCKA